MSLNQVKKDIKQIKNRTEKLTPNIEQIAEIIRHYLIDKSLKLQENMNEMAELLADDIARKHTGLMDD